MALLLPSQFDVDSVNPESERKVIRDLLATLSDEWYLVPKVPILVDGQNAEIDLILVSQNFGALLLEIKGGLISVREGDWYQYDRKLKKNPFDQITKAKHKLISRLREMRVDTSGLFLSEVVVLPDVGDVPPAGLGPGAPRDRIWTKYDLLGASARVGLLHREKNPISTNQLQKFLRALCPTVELTESGGRFHAAMVNRIDSATRLHLDSLIGLADNQRFLVTGGAGTGKTYLAEAWARRCASRGERTLLLSYNVPLAEDLAVRLEDTEIVVGSYHRFVLGLLKPFGIVVPSQVEPDWWDRVPPAALVENAASITDRFDAIVLDEGQDFKSHWMEALTSLFRPTGPKRLLLVADHLQALYTKNWTPPRDVPYLTLTTNLRSSKTIGSHVAKLGGASPNSSAPVGPAVKEIKVLESNVVGVVANELSRLTAELEIPSSQIVVLARHRQLRDKLLSSQMPIPLVRWEERDEGKIVCETIHRVKGLERVAVLVVDLDVEKDNMTDYIGASRAILHLIKISLKVEHSASTSVSGRGGPPLLER